MTVGMSLHTHLYYIGFSAKGIGCYDSVGNLYRGQWADITKHQGNFVRAQQQMKELGERKGTENMGGT